LFFWALSLFWAFSSLIGALIFGCFGLFYVGHVSIFGLRHAFPRLFLSL
jgi:hypothetical protein